MDVDLERARVGQVSVDVDAVLRLGRTVADRADPTSCRLRFIDSYGDAVFNHIQIPVLIHEIRQRLEVLDTPRLRDHASRILELLEHARGEVHVYTWFVGD